MYVNLMAYTLIHCKCIYRRTQSVSENMHVLVLCLVFNVKSLFVPEPLASEYQVHAHCEHISWCRILADLLRRNAPKASRRLTSLHASFVTMTCTSDVTLPADTLPRR